MLTALFYMLGINACVGLAGFAFGRLTAPDKVVTIIQRGEVFRGEQFDLLNTDPYGNVFPIQRGQP